MALEERQRPLPGEVGGGLVVAVGGTEFAGKSVVMGALTLYLDFINMFLFLLRLFGDRR